MIMTGENKTENEQQDFFEKFSFLVIFKSM